MPETQIVLSKIETGNPPQPSKTVGRGKAKKPAKPHKAYPLYAHGSGQWAKKVRGRLHYFGVWSDPTAALKRWNDTKDDLLEGRPPRVRDGDLLIRDLLNHFLTAKQDAVEAGELSPRSFRDYKDACERIIETFPREWSVESLGPDDFAAGAGQAVQIVGGTGQLGPAM